LIERGNLVSETIETEEEYKAALAEIECLFNCVPGTAEEKQLDSLVD